MSAESDFIKREELPILIHYKQLHRDEVLKNEELCKTLADLEQEIENRNDMRVEQPRQSQNKMSKKDLKESHFLRRRYYTTETYIPYGHHEREVSDLKAQTKKLQKMLNKPELGIASMDSTIMKQKLEIDELMQNVVKLESGNVTLQTTIDRLETQMEEAAKENMFFENSITEVLKDNHLKDAEITTFQQTIRAKDTELLQTSQMLDQVKQNASDAKHNFERQLSENIEEYTRKIEMLSNEFNEKAEIFKIQKETEITKLHESITEQTEELEQVKTTVEMYKKKLEEENLKNTKIEILSREFSEKEEIFKMQKETEITKLHATITEKTEELEQVKSTVEMYEKRLEEENLKNTTKIENLTTEIEKLQSILVSLSHKLDASGAVRLATQVKSMLFENDPKQQERGLNSIHALVSSQTRERIGKIEGLLSRIEVLSDSQYNYVQGAAERALQQIGNTGVVQYGRGLNIECQYFKRCQGFLQSLKIDAYLDPRFNCCYCYNCSKQRGHVYQDNYKGDPLRQYSTPTDWCRFTLKTNEGQAADNDIWEKWNVAFHRTKKESIRKILKVGHLVMPDDTVQGGFRIGVRPGHIPENDKTRRIFLSPSISYSGLDQYSSRAKYYEKAHGTSYYSEVAFQVRIKPDSFEVGPETVGATDQIDPSIPYEELEWSTREHGSTTLCGILVRLEIRYP